MTDEEIIAQLEDLNRRLNIRRMLRLARAIKREFNHATFYFSNDVEDGSLDVDIVVDCDNKTLINFAIDNVYWNVSLHNETPLYLSDNHRMKKI